MIQITNKEQSLTKIKVFLEEVATNWNGSDDRYVDATGQSRTGEEAELAAEGIVVIDRLINHPYLASVDQLAEILGQLKYHG